jgi:hypothetical protein
MLRFFMAVIMPPAAYLSMILTELSYVDSNVIMTVKSFVTLATVCMGRVGSWPYQQTLDQWPILQTFYGCYYATSDILLYDFD